MVLRKPHPFGHDADDRGRDLVDLDRLPDDARIAAVAALPETVPDQHHGLGVLSAVLFPEVAPEGRGLSEESEHIGRHQRARGAFGRTARFGDVHAGRPEAGQTAERFGPAAPLLELGPGGRELVAARGVQQVHVEELMRVFEREPPDQHRIDEGEDRSVHADAKRQGEHGDCREARILGEHPHRVLEVLHHGHRAVYESEAGSVRICRTPHLESASSNSRDSHPAALSSGFDIEHSALLASSDMPQGTAHLAAITLASRFTLFVTERFPFAARGRRSVRGLSVVPLTAMKRRSKRCAAGSVQSCERASRVSHQPEPGDTTPGIPSRERVAQAVDEVAAACDGFLRRASIRASLTATERREILRGMMLTRATDNRLKAFFAGGEVRYGDAAFQGKGFRSLGQEAIYAAGIRLRRGSAFAKASASAEATAGAKATADQTADQTDPACGTETSSRR